MTILIIGSSTRTIRAQEILRLHGISSKIKRLDSVRDGCVRGLMINEKDRSRAAEILAEKGIPVKGFTEARE